MNARNFLHVLRNFVGCIANAPHAAVRDPRTLLLQASHSSGEIASYVTAWLDL
jgi:hypothetical protein